MATAVHVASFNGNRHDLVVENGRRREADGAVPAPPETYSGDAEPTERTSSRTLPFVYAGVGLVVDLQVAACVQPDGLHLY
jgi:hypothetical protein